MAEVLRDGRPRAEHHTVSNLFSWVINAISAGSSSTGDPDERGHEAGHADPPDASYEPPHYNVPHGGWSSVGWQEDDPTPEEAMSALASMSRTDYATAVAGLRKGAEAQLAALPDEDASAQAQQQQ